MCLESRSFSFVINKRTEHIHDKQNRILNILHIPSLSLSIHCSSRHTTTIGTIIASCYPDVSKVKIQSTTGEHLSFFEVQALSNGANVAVNKIATQSSTWPQKPASNAVDGNISTFSQTNDETGTSPWWMVDFQGTFATEFIKR